VAINHPDMLHCIFGISTTVSRRRRVRDALRLPRLRQRAPGFSNHLQHHLVRREALN
jgi:hypothetical protein